MPSIKKKIENFQVVELLIG